MSSSSIPFAGSVLSAYGAQQAGNQQSELMNYNADIQERSASEALSGAALNAQKQSMTATRVLGQMSTGYAANGVEQSSGSVTAALGASAANAELDRQNILYGGQIKAVNYDNQASLDRASASNILQASYVNTLSALVGGGGNAVANNMGGGSGNVDEGAYGMGGSGMNDVSGGSSSFESNTEDTMGWVG